MDSGIPQEQSVKIRPKIPRKPTMKQKAFVKVLLETNNASEAIRQTYNVSASQVGTIHSMAHENLSKPTIQALVEQMKTSYVNDSFEAYAIQKDILRQSYKYPKSHELANKIANKIQDRAGFSPTKKSENKNMTAKFIITRGDTPQPDTSIVSTENATVIEP